MTCGNGWWGVSWGWRSGMRSERRSSSAWVQTSPIRFPRSSGAGPVSRRERGPTTPRWPATSGGRSPSADRWTRTTCCGATSNGSPRILRMSEPSRDGCSAASETASPDAAERYVSERGPEISAGNGSVMYCAPLGAFRAARPEPAPRGGAGAVGDHALGSALPHRLPGGDARRGGARSRRGASGGGRGSGGSGSRPRGR